MREKREELIRAEESKIFWEFGESVGSINACQFMIQTTFFRAANQLECLIDELPKKSPIKADLTRRLNLMRSCYANLDSHFKELDRTFSTMFSALDETNALKTLAKTRIDEGF